MKDNFCRKKEQKFSCRCCLFCYFIEAKKKKKYTQKIKKLQKRKVGEENAKPSQDRFSP